MARLRDAGLNPNLIYGSSSSGASGQAEKIQPERPRETTVENPLEGINRFADYGKTTQTTDNLKAQNTVLAQEAILKGAQTADLGVKSAKGSFDLGLAKELRDTSLQAAKANLRSLEAGTITKTLDNSFKSQSLKNRVKDIQYSVKNAKQTLKGQELLNELRQLEVELKRIGIERNDPWYFRIFGRQLGKEGIDQIFKTKK